jgi:hypothetical protein
MVRILSDIHGMCFKKIVIKKPDVLLKTQKVCAERGFGRGPMPRQWSCFEILSAGRGFAASAVNDVFGMENDEKHSCSSDFAMKPR